MTTPLNWRGFRRLQLSIFSGGWSVDDRIRGTRAEEHRAAPRSQSKVAVSLAVSPRAGGSCRGRQPKHFPPNPNALLVDAVASPQHRAISPIKPATSRTFHSASLPVESRCGPSCATRERRICPALSVSLESAATRLTRLSSRCTGFELPVRVYSEGAAQGTTTGKRPGVPPS